MNSPASSPKLNAVKPPPLNEDQERVLQAAIDWINDPDAGPFFILKGYAGTGKTFTVKVLVDRVKGRFAFSAPTNKATKVLRESFSGTGYKPECKTIYSLLGLRLEANGEIKELKAAEKKDKDGNVIDLSMYKLVIVDEASMLPLMLLRDHITKAHNETGVRFLFMGDPAQLPPVKEVRSPVWSLEQSGTPTYQLTKVMRHDNQILNLVTDIRNQVDAPAGMIHIKSDHADNEGVWKMNRIEWLQHMRALATTGAFHEGRAKAIAWRNTIVDQLNAWIRSAYFPEVTVPWVEGDRVLFTSPAKDLDDEPMASTDDEGVVTRVQEDYHPYFSHLKIYVVDIELDGGKRVTARVLHPLSKSTFEKETQDLAAKARVNGKLWKDFWYFKESFHELRQALALTSHRSQGSTYETVYVDSSDILRNPTRTESLRCLYVATSRPKKQLFIA